MNSHKHNGTAEQSASLARKRKRRHFTVEPSPLNTVKLDLAIILIAAVIVVALVSGLVDEPLEQFVWLGGYGLLATLWLVVRVRRVVQACHRQYRQDSDET